ncbi:hypothetical protein MMC29_007930 [Sticta canariensis]|nr:hypothetical protein [Sticta canariensis]
MTMSEDHGKLAAHVADQKDAHIIREEQAMNEDEKRRGESTEDQVGADQDLTSSPAGNTLDSDDEVYPEGGLRAWLVVLGSFSAMVASFGLMNTIGTFQAYISTHQLHDLDQGTIAWIFSLFVFLSFFSGVQIGPIFDAKGPRILVLAGSVSLVVSMMLLGSCHEYWHFIVVFGLLGGLGTALIFVPAVAAIGHFFRIGRGNATGVATTGGSIGGIIFPLMLESLFPKIGFAWSTRVMGFVFLFLLTIGNIFIRSRLPPKPGGSVLPDFRIFRKVPFSLTTAGVLFVEWGLFVPLSFMSSCALAHGFSTTFSYQILAIINAGSFFGRWLPGYVADYIGRFNTMILTVLLCLIATFALWLPAANSTALMVVYSVLFGLGSGSNISLAPVCVSQMCTTEEYGRYYATCYTIVSFGGLTGLPIAGRILSANKGHYWGLIIFTGACYALGLIFFGAARVTQVGWKLTAKY